MDGDRNVNSWWKNIKEKIQTSAEKVLGFEEQKKRPSWFHDECEEKITIQKEARNKMLDGTTCRTLEEYRIARTEAKNMCRRKSKLFQENTLQELQDKFGRNETRKYYESICNIKRGFQPRPNMCQDKLVAGDAEVLNRRKEYSEEHLNCNVIRNLEASGDIYYDLELETSELTAKMVYDVIKNLQTRTAPGEDGISAELIKRGGQRLWKEIYELIQIIQNTEDFPENWKIAIICPIHKKGGKLICNNYIGISLLNATYKIFTTILAKYIEPLC
jgi:hypothetical protein